MCRRGDSFRAFELVTRFLVGELQVVAAQFQYHEEYSVESEASLRCRTQRDVPISIELNWLQNISSNFLHIAGSTGQLDVKWSSTQWKVRDGKVESLAGAYNKVEAFASQLETFADVLSVKEVLNGETVWDVDDGARSVELIHMAYSLNEK